MAGERLRGVRHEMAVACVVYAVLVAGLSPGHFWLDAGELAAAASELGVMHPPGAAGLGLVLHAVTALPFGAIGFRLAAGSALLGAAAAAGLMAFLRGRGVRARYGWLAVALLVTSTTFMRHAHAVEVYTYGLALFAWAYALLDRRSRFGNRPLAFFFAAVGALACGDLRLLLGGVGLVSLLRAFGRRERSAAFAVVGGLWGTLVVLSVPLASLRQPRTNWGHPSDLAALWDHLTAGRILRAYADEIASPWPALWWSHARQFAAWFLADWGHWGASCVVVLAVLGGVAWRRSSAAGVRPFVGSFRLIAVGLVLQATYGVFVNPMGLRDLQVGLPFLWCLAALVGLVLEIVARTGARVSQRIGVAVAVMCLAALAPRGFADGSVTSSQGPASWIRGSLAELPAGVLLLTQTDDLAAGTTYAQVVEGARPDVVAVPIQHLHLRGTGVDAREIALRERMSALPTEVSRVEAALATWTGPVAVEGAGVGLTAGLHLDHVAARVPLTVRGVEGEEAVAGLPSSPVAHEGADAAWRRWQGRLVTPEDRTRLASALADRARAHVRFGGPAGLHAALEELTVVVEAVAPEHAGALTTLGAIHDRLGHADLAIAWTRRALAADPDRVVALLNLARYLARSPEAWDEAERAAARAASLRPYAPETWERLAEIRERRSDLVGAGAARSEAAEARRRAQARVP